MPSLNLPAQTKKIAFIVLSGLAVVIIVVSGIILVKSAKLRTGITPSVASAEGSSVLKVSTSNESPLDTSDTVASSTLQGASSGSVGTSNGSNSAAPVTVKPIPAGTKRVCDETAGAKYQDDYDANKLKEDAYHSSLLGLLSSEGILMVNSEQTRYDTALTKLKKTLNDSLASIACPLSR